MNNLLESRQEPIPGYRLVERLGRGGYGDVWKVEAPGGFMKAMKFVFGSVGDESEVAADQELDALRRLVQIRHPFILSVERCDIVDGQVLITMELADRNLEDRFNECRSEGLPGVPRDELLRYMVEAAEALDLLSQEYRLQHLDIKPTNLFLVRKHVKVGDFGLVKHLEGFEAPIRSGLTPLYAPPESYEGRISLNSDQYSLALVYHEMLIGRRAIDGESGRELMYRTLVEGPNLSSVMPGERAVLARALAKKPIDRFPTCLAFVEALQSAASSVGETAFDEEAERTMLDQVRPKSVQISNFNDLPGGDGDDSKPPRPPSKMVQRRLRKVATADLVGGLRPEAHADGTLQPTLVIGLGGFGVRMAESVRIALTGQFGEAAESLPINVLNIDVDPAALRHAGVAEGGLTESPLAVCRLRKGAEYRGEWESLKHISSWLDQEQIFRIGASGETRGLRSLGRLALMDNFDRVAQQILGNIVALLSAETAEEVNQTTGLRYRRTAPCVYIAAGMGGGAGAGMAIDIAYLVRAMLEKAGFRHPNVCLALASGIELSREKDLQIANQFALANDLAAFSAPECGYAFPVRFGDLPERMSGPPAKTTLLFDLEAEHLPAPKDIAVLESFAEYVVQSATGGHDALAMDGAPPIEPFVGVGWFSLVHPYDQVLRAGGCEFAVKVLDRWLVPLDENETESHRKYAKEFFESRGYEPTKVAELLQKEAAAQAGQPLHAKAAERINDLIEKLDTREGKKNPQPLVFELRSELRTLLGGDPVDDQQVYDAPTPYDTAYKNAAMVVAESLFQPIQRELESVVETVDRRFEVVRGVWTGFSDTLAGLIKRLVESSKTKDLEREAYDAAYELHKQIVLGAAPRTFVSTVERWVKTKLDHNGRQQLIGLYQVLKSKIDELAVRVFTAPRKLLAAKQWLQELRDQTIDSPASLVRQPIFPGGSVSAAEALQVLQSKLNDENVDCLEETLRTDIFTPAGGIWETCSRPDIPAEVLGDSMAAGSAAWLLKETQIQDAAEVFLQRNQDAPEQSQTELRSFLDWSAPSFIPNAPGKKIEIKATVFLPASEAGQSLANAIHDLGDERVHRFASHSGNEVHFLQTAAAASLGRLAPLWLLRGKPLFESHKYRGSAVVYPQTVDV